MFLRLFVQWDHAYGALSTLWGTCGPTSSGTRPSPDGTWADRINTHVPSVDQVWHRNTHHPILPRTPPLSAEIAQLFAGAYHPGLGIGKISITVETWREEVPYSPASRCFCALPVCLPPHVSVKRIGIDKSKTCSSRLHRHVASTAWQEDVLSMLAINKLSGCTLIE